MRYLYDSIKNKCKKLNLSITQLEKKCGLSPGSIIKWNSSSPKLDNIIRVAEELKTPLSELIDIPLSEQEGVIIISKLTEEEMEEKSFIHESIIEDIGLLNLEELRELYNYLGYLKYKQSN